MKIVEPPTPEQLFVQQESLPHFINTFQDSFDAGNSLERDADDDLILDHDEGHEETILDKGDRFINSDESSAGKSDFEEYASSD